MRGALTTKSLDSYIYFSVAQVRDSAISSVIYVLCEAQKERRYNRVQSLSNSGSARRSVLLVT